MNTPKPISIGFISRVDSGAVQERLTAEAAERGHTFTQISFTSSDLTHPEQAFEKHDLLSYDVLYYRTGLGYAWAFSLEDYLHQHGRDAVNLGTVEHPFRQQKTQQIVSVSNLDVATPKTILSKKPTYDVLATALGKKFIAKADNSSQGRDVHSVVSADDLAPILAADAGKDYFFQEYIPHEHDFRVYIVGGKAVAVVQREPAADDFRTNLSQGGCAYRVVAAEAERLFPKAEAVAQALGLEICAVDFLERSTDSTLFFVEANNNPGWDYTTKEVLGVDLAVLVMDYLEEVAARAKEAKTA